MKTRAGPKVLAQLQFLLDPSADKQRARLSQAANSNSLLSTYIGLIILIEKNRLLMIAAFSDSTQWNGG